MKPYVWRSSVSCLLVLMTLACPGGDEVGHDKVLGDLTLAERQALCSELHPYYLRVWNGDCTTEALDSDPSGGADCKRERMSCLDDSAADCMQISATPSQDDCVGVHVDDLRECTKASAELNEKKFGEAVDCSTGVHPTDEILTMPNACRRVEAACPKKSTSMPVTAGGAAGGIAANPQRPNSDQRDPSGLCPAPSEIDDHLDGWQLNPVARTQMGSTDEYKCDYFAYRHGNIHVVIDQTTTPTEFEATKVMKTKDRMVGTFADAGHDFYYVMNDFSTDYTLYALKGSVACSVSAETTPDQLRLISLQVYAALER